MKEPLLKSVGPFVMAVVVLIAFIGLLGTASAKGQKKAAGGSHSMTGCLKKGDEANTFKLTSVEGSGPKTVEIVGMASGVDLSPHVGHKVTITGTAVGTKAAAKAEGTKGAKEERGEHHMRVSAVKMVSTTC